MGPEDITRLRSSILECQNCFVGSEQRCLHHEDLVGGYQPGKIVFVGINPQASPTSRFYQALQRASDDQKMLLGDHLRYIFAGHSAPRGLEPEYYIDHPGREWIESSARLLGVSMHEFAEHIRSVELFKHASAGVPDLVRLGNIWTRMRENCPKLLERQLAVLSPRLVVFSGNAGLRFIRDYTRTALPPNISQVHGRVFGGEIGVWQGPVLLTLAVSRQNNWKWSRLAEASEQVRTTIRNAIIGNSSPTPSASPSSSVDAFDPDSMFLVESKYEQIHWDGSVSTGTRCEGYDTYLHLIPLPAKLVGQIAVAEWQERGGRKFGPLLSPSGTLAEKATQPDAWFFSKNPSGYFPNVSSRVSSRLDDGRPVPLTKDEIEAIEDESGS